MAAAEVCSYLKLSQEHVVHSSCESLFILERRLAFSACARLSKSKLILTLCKWTFPVSDIPNRRKSLKLARHSTRFISLLQTLPRTAPTPGTYFASKSMDKLTCLGGYVTASLVTTSFSLPKFSHLLKPILTKENAVSIVSRLSWARPNVPSLWPATDVL